MLRTLPLLLLAAASLVWACSTQKDPCLQPQQVQVSLHSYRFNDSTGAEVDSLLPHLALFSVHAKTPTGIIYSAVPGSGTSAFALTLSDLADTTRWSVQPDSGVSAADTVTFVYQRQLHFISNACGYTYYFNLSQVTSTTHALDSIFLLNPLVTNDPNTVHVKIVY